MPEKTGSNPQSFKIFKVLNKIDKMYLSTD